MYGILRQPSSAYRGKRYAKVGSIYYARYTPWTPLGEARSLKHLKVPMWYILGGALNAALWQRKAGWFTKK